MQKILNRRIMRDLKKNFCRYLSLVLLIVMGMYLVISVVGAAENVIVGVGKAADKNQVEDGEFTVFVPLEKSDIVKLQDRGVMLEKEYYLDYTLEDDSTLRIYQNRQKINLIDLEEGKLAENNDEIVIEKHYAEKHNLSITSEITVASHSYHVTGICSTPDYDCVLKNMSDSTVQSSRFGTGFVTSAQYERLESEDESSNTEEYIYSYILNGEITEDELKSYLRDIEFDKKKVSDPYFIEMLDQLNAMQMDIQNGIQQLSEGASELNTGLSELGKNNKKLKSAATELFVKYLAEASKGLSDYGIKEELTEDNYERVINSIISTKGESNALLRLKLKSILDQLDDLKAFKDGIITYMDGEANAIDGSNELADGMNELQDKTDELINQYFEVDIDNLIQFVKKTDNPRIGASLDDVLINRDAGIVAGVIVMVLFTYVISVFVIHGIEQESTMIGALYALGVTRQQLLKHYLLLPVLITLCAGVIGTVIGFSPVGMGIQMADTIGYFSLPKMSMVYPIQLLIYGIIMPPFVAMVVNYFVINKKLSQPVLKMIRNEQTISKISNVNLGNVGFATKFQIRQFLREIRTSFTVVFGMFIALLVMMMGIDCYTICHNMSVQNKKDTKYEYMYSYKYPTEEVPAGGEPCYAESLKKPALGYNLDVTLLGIDEDNPYLDFEVGEGKNKVTVSQSVATKYHLDVGEKIVLTDEVNDMDYAFTIDKIVPYSVGLYVFMNIKDMRILFGQEDDYYNVVLSDKSLNIDTGRLYATVTKTDISKSAEVFIRNMTPMIVSMIGVSILMFVVVMYLMIKVMIDRSTFHISLMKIFGFRQKEIKKLYLEGTFIMVAISAAICVPLSKTAMDVVYPYLVSNVACGMNLAFPWWMYVSIYTGVISCYLIIHWLLVGKLKKMVPAEVLKNRE